MHIAVCDDNPLELNRILSFLIAYRQEKSIPLTYKAYLSAAELVSTMKSCQYDLLILDILIPEFSGIQAAQEIRAFDSSVRIIFLTSSPEFALDSYTVRASDYILKPLSPEKLFSVLDSILADQQESFDGIPIKTQNGILHILFSKLAFVEVMNKHLYFHMSDESVRDVHAPLSEYEKKILSGNGFIKVHRSYIVNLWHMSELTPNSFISNRGESIPISRLIYGEVRKAFMEHLFVEAKFK